MNKILKLIAISALGAVFAVGAFAQAAGPNGSGLQGGKQGGAGKEGKLGGARNLQKMQVEILQKITPPLTADQKTKIEQLNQKTKDAVKALRDKAGTGDRAALRTEMQKIQADRKQAMEAILTPEQRKSYAELLKAAMEKAKADGKAGKAGKAGKGGGTKNG